jgi:hypothetical protein
VPLIVVGEPKAPQVSGPVYDAWVRTSVDVAMPESVELAVSS